MKSDIIAIQSRDYWFKIIEMLQQNWALIDIDPDGSCLVYFMHDGSGVFDEMHFTSEQEAQSQLKQNGFRRYAEDSKAQEFISTPKSPFYKDSHPNGPIYSSGRYWSRTKHRDKNSVKDGKQTPYNCHTSKKLQDCFIKKPWQGEDPKKACFLFVGLDANFEPESKIPPAFFKGEILTYLDDGVGYWQKRGFHHPFMHPDYRGSGRLYHERFAQIGFKPDEANLVSFVELLHVPTTGRSNLNANDLCPDHLYKLADWFSRGSAQYIFFVSSKVTRLIRQAKNSHDFDLLPLNHVQMDKDFKDLKVLRKKNGQTIYGIYHFSVHYREQVTVLERQIAQIREIVRTFTQPRAL